MGPKNIASDSKIATREVFVVNYLDTSEGEKIRRVGPFHNKEEALSACKVFLKKGTCSWLVRNNG